MDATRDALGKEIDAGIRDVVAGLWIYGVETSQSCEGHDDWGCPMPWVDILPAEAPSVYEMSVVERERWRRRSLASQMRVSELLGEFYEGRETDRLIALTLKPLGRFGAARLESMKGNDPELRSDGTNATVIASCRFEMDEFASWLRFRTGLVTAPRVVSPRTQA